MAVAIQTITFWLNAFIPEHIAGYTIRVPAGPHVGKTMIPGPGSVNLRWAVGNVPISDIDFVRGVTGRPFRGRERSFGLDAIGVADCFLTDQRGFSSDINASYRMHSEFRLDFTKSPVAMKSMNACGCTTEVDCEDGDVEYTGRGDTSRMSITLKHGASKSPDDPMTVTMKCAAAHPGSIASRLFGDIDYVGEITIDRGRRRLEFEGKLDAFPAFEAYATINEGPPTTVFREMPPPGNTVLNLSMGANRPIKRILEDARGLGRFEPVSGTSR